MEAGPSGTRTNNLTRSLDGENGEMEVKSDSTPDIAPSAVAETSKKLESDMSGGALPGSVRGGPQQLSMNLPFPSPHGKTSIVKLCDVKDGDIRLNDSIEVVEIVSLDPTLAAPEGDEENTSLVPRLNVLSFSNLDHNSPLLPSSGPFPPL